MSTTTNLSTLKINYLTQSQYEEALDNNTIGTNEIYMTPATDFTRGKVGVITAYAGSDEPTGWLKCDGRAISRTTYAELFNVIGITYGAGDGSTTFNIPDLCGRVITGTGTLSGNTYDLGDEIDAGIPNITGTMTERSTNYNTSNISWGSGLFTVTNYTGQNADGLSQVNGSINTKLITFDASKANSIYGNSTTVQPNTLALNFLICYENNHISSSAGNVNAQLITWEEVV